MLKQIKSTYETVTVENFLSVKAGSIEVKDITAIIGPQASGKSIFAKLIFFGRNYMNSYFREVLEETFLIRTFKQEQNKTFVELFGGLIGFEQSFSIQYVYGEFEIKVERKVGHGKPKITQSPSIDKMGTNVKREYLRFQESWRADEKKVRRNPSKYEFILRSEGVKDFFASLPQVLFVPASRSFYSTISEELFTFLAADERVDPLTAQFGSFYEFAKRQASSEWFGATAGQHEQAKWGARIRPVIDGEFLREKSKDYIKTAWGKVPLRSASSGQQEALPLLFSLLAYPDSVVGAHLIIVEEPEAHLFPTSQKYVLDLIVEQVMSTGCDVLFTTHSPYVLACLNNHIVRFASKKIQLGRNVEIAAYLTNRGGVEGIVDVESGLVNTEILDNVSEVIASELLEIIGE